MRNTGARGLRSIVENVLMDTMFTLPSDETVEKCIITKAVVDGQAAPELVHGEPQLPSKKGQTKKSSRIGFTRLPVEMIRQPFYDRIWKNLGPDTENRQMK